MAWELEEEEVSFPSKVGQVASDVGRGVGRNISNVATRLQGIPGDVFSLVNDLIAKPIKKAITGKESVPYEETALGKVIEPTSKIRERRDEVHGDIFKPKSESEKFVDDIVEDTALMFMPGKQVTRGGKALSAGQQAYRNLAKSVGANFVGEAAKDFGGDEKTGNYVKSGALFLLSLMDKPAAAKQIAKRYKEAENALPSGAQYNARPLAQGMDRITNFITKGRPSKALSTAEKFVVDEAKKVKSLINNGMIPVDQAWAQLRTVNNKLSEILPTLPWKQRKGVKTHVTQINKELNNTLKDYGRTNPSFGKNFESAQEAFGTMAQSNFIGNWVQKNVKSGLVNEGLLALFGSSLGKAAAGASIPYTAAQLMYRINKSPTLRRIYGDTLKAATKENAGTFNKYLGVLDKELEKELKKEKWELED